MRKSLFLIICCILICAGAYRWGGAGFESAKQTALELGYKQVCSTMLPYIKIQNRIGKSIVYQDVEYIMAPAIASYRTEMEKEWNGDWENVGQGDGASDEFVVSNEIGGSTESEISFQAEGMCGQENSSGSGSDDVGISKGDDISEGNDVVSDEQASVNVGSLFQMEKKVEISRIKLQDFDYLRQNFYQVDNTTTIGSEMLNINKLLGVDMTLEENVEGPQVLIYHTHSQECYADSIPGDPSTSVVALGDYLELLLEEQYGIQVLHHKGQYDVERRDSAYSEALPDLEQILKDNPTIEVVIDLHRDGVAEQTHLVTEINGKPTAQIMFFNGLSRTTAQGELSNLANPYIEDNLAFSFQMQLAASEYYPGFARRIYLKGYRYNMHLCPKSLLVEVGAQTNTFEEAKNAMEPLANLLAFVLTQNQE